MFSWFSLRGLAAKCAPHRLGLTVNVMLLVTLLGCLSAAATLHATWYMQVQARYYHTLLSQQAQAAHHLGVLRHHMGTLRQLVIDSVPRLAPTDEDDTATPDMGHVDLGPIQHLHQLITQELQYLTPLLPGLDDVLQQLHQAQTALTQQSHTVAQNWHDGLHYIARAQVQHQLLPTVDTSINRVAQLQHDTHALYQTRVADLAQELHGKSQRSVLLALLALALSCTVGGALALRYVSRPIARLTHAMQALTLQRWDAPIPALERHDEIGDMARSLQRLRHTLQQTEALQLRYDAQQHNQLLTEQLLELTSALPGPVFQALWTPGQGTVRMHFISRQWRQMLGLPAHHPDTLEAALLAFEQYCPDTRAEFNRQLHQAAQTLQQVDFSTTYTRIDNTLHWCKVLATPSLRPDGSVLFNGVWFDISREAEQSQALQTAKQQAEESAQARALLQASISHEIRTPLNAILGLTQLALKQPDAPHNRAHLDNILRAGIHLRGIINEVLEFSKIDAGQLHLESTDFRLSNVLDDVLMMCLESAKQKGLQLSYHVASDVPDCLRGDPHRIAQILLNYVNNAIKFTPVGSVRIDIALAPTSSLHRIVLHASVTDTGLGIPADRLPTLFNPFQQADSSITRRFGGTGLGLAIARELALLMNGQTGVQSQPNQGSTFWFTAMLEPARTPVPRNAAATPETAMTSPPAHLQGLRVLVVDDNPLNRTVTQAMLQSGGMLVDTADNGQVALQRLLPQPEGYYAAVLMDLQMPVLDGLSATRQLRQHPHLRQLPVIAMTAHTGLSDVQKALEAGMTAHLGKPILESSMWQALQQSIPAPSALHTGAPPTAAVTPAIQPSSANALAQQSPPLAPTPPEAPQPGAEPIFDASALDDLARLLPPDKLQPLVQQFVQDTQKRMAQMHLAMLDGDTATLRAETHKIRGTAATFGQLRLHALAESFSQALHQGDQAQAQQLLDAMQSCCQAGIERLQQHLSASTASAAADTHAAPHLG